MTGWEECLNNYDLFFGQVGRKTSSHITPCSVLMMMMMMMMISGFVEHVINSLQNMLSVS